MSQSVEKSYGIIPLRHSEDKWNVFIILHKMGNHWGFPKGHADEGETPYEAAVRELLEETGLKVEKSLLTDPISESYTFSRKGTDVLKQVYYYPAIVSGAFLLQPEEIRDGKWVPIEDANDLLTFDEAKKILAKVKALFPF